MNITKLSKYHINSIIAHEWFDCIVEAPFVSLEAGGCITYVVEKLKDEYFVRMFKFQNQEYSEFIFNAE